MSDLNIKPIIKSDDFYNKQSKYEHIPKLPSRTIILGPSGSGKTNMLANLITNIYNNCFERIYIWSPSLQVDKTYKYIMDYQSKNLQTEDDKLYFDEYNEEELEDVINMQQKVIEYQKKQKQKKMFNIAIIIDDFADTKEFLRNSHMLQLLFIRGRHFFISTFILSQKYNILSPIIRINATALMIFKLRNGQELETFLTENSAILDKKKLLKIYEKATEKKYDFLYVNLMASDPNNMFYLNFTNKFKIN